jgi:putative ABC transport system permease protein
MALSAKERADLGSWYFGVLTRLKPDVSLDRAQAELDAIAAALAAAHPKARGERGFRLVGLQADLASRAADGLRLLQGVVVVVLIIACVNVANLLLSQAAGRSREMGVRAAIGASRGRLIRQLLTESVVLAAAGAALGVVLAFWGVRALVALAPPFLLPANVPIGVSWPVLLVTAAVALVTGVLFGLAPALASSSRPAAAALKNGARTAPAGLSLARRHRLRAGLVAVEVALALLLLTGAALLVRSFTALLRQPTGVDATHVLTAQVTLPAARYATDQARRAFWEDLVGRLAGLPGVHAAAGSTALPFSLWEWQTGFTIKGREQVPNDGAGIRTITPALFSTLGIPIVRGRAFLPSDTAAAERVAIVSDAFARMHLAGVDPMGQLITTSYSPGRDAPGQRVATSNPDPQWARIVGVAGATRHQSLAEAPRSEIYLPLAQQPGPGTLVLALRAAADPTSLAPALRATVRDVDPNLPVVDVTTMANLIGAKLARSRFAMNLMALFALLAAALATGGVYGVMAYTVSEGRREVGIRLALGAHTRQIQARVVVHGLAVVTAGAVGGGAAALWLSGLLKSELFSVTPTDLVAFAGAATTIVVIGLAACWLPARRLSRVDPAGVLRAE